MREVFIIKILDENNQMRELNTSDIKEQEGQVRDTTSQRLAGFSAYFDEGINLMIGLKYRIPKIETIDPAEKEYLTHFDYSFLVSTFTFRACFLLFQSGYYLEAHILSRNLIEVLVKLRYYEKHKDVFHKEVLNSAKVETRNKPRVQFKKMFDEVLPGYYEVDYKWILSDAAHGGVSSWLFKNEIKSATDVKPHTGVFFHEDWASLVANHLSVFMLGYIRFYKHIYPKVIENLDSIKKQEFDAVEAKLLENFESHIKLKKGENRWHKVARNIFEIK